MQIEKPDCIEEKAKVLLHEIMYDIDCISEGMLRYGLHDKLRGELYALYHLKLINEINYNYLKSAIHDRVMDVLHEKKKEVIK